MTGPVPHDPAPQAEYGIKAFQQLTGPELAARKRRNTWIAIALVAFMVLLFTTTVLRMMHNQAEARAQREAAVAASVR